MASVIYHSFLRDVLTGAVDCDTDTFKVMACTSTYSENKDTHAKRSDVTNEITGTGYTAGGNSCTLTVNAIDTTNDRVELTLGGTTWTSSTLTARKFIVYKARGGASSADELVACIDNGSDVTTSSGTLTLNSSTLRIQN